MHTRSGSSNKAGSRRTFFTKNHNIKVVLEEILSMKQEYIYYEKGMREPERTIIN